MALRWQVWVLQTGAKCRFVCLCVCMYCMRGRSGRKILHFHLFISSIHRLFLYRHVWCRNNYDKTENPKNKHWTFKITKWEQRDFFFQHNTSQETTGSDLHHITSWFFHFTCLSFFVVFNGNDCTVRSFTLCLIFSPCIPPETSSDKTVSLWYQQTGRQRKIA